MVQGLLVNGYISYNACEVGAASRVVAERLFLHTASCFGGIQDFSYDHLDRIIHIRYRMLLGHRHRRGWEGLVFVMLLRVSGGGPLRS